MVVIVLLMAVKMVFEISLAGLRNTWITILVALTGMTILLSTIGIKVPIVQIFVNGSLRAIAYICKGFVKLITIIPSWIRGLYNVITGILKSFGMNEVPSNIIAIIIIIAII